MRKVQLTLRANLARCQTSTAATPGYENRCLTQMDTYLDPSLGGPLAFLDSSSQLHAPSPSDPSNQPLTFDSFDSWLNPVTGPPYEASQGLSVAHGPAQVAPLSLDGRPSLSSGHFGVHHLHADAARVITKPNSAPLSPLSPAVHGSGSMHLPFSTTAEYPEGMFHARANLSSQSFVHPSPSAPSDSGTESMSIAMYDRPVGNGAAAGPRDDFSSTLQDLRNPSISSNASSSSSTARHTLSPSASTLGKTALGRSASIASAAHATSTRSSSGQGRSPPTTRSKGSKPSQADESVPEAALHLLRLALPTGSTGSAATNTTGDDDRSGDEDAEGESDDTSIHSTDLKALGKLFPDVNAQPVPFETTVWNHSEGQPPLHVQRGGGPGSRRPSVASSAASARVRQHNPARAQREASVASARSRLGSEAPLGARPNLLASPAASNGPAAAVGRRSVARGRRSNVSAVGDVGAESDGTQAEGDESEAEYQEGDAYEDAGDATDTGRGKGKKKAAKGAATAAKGKGKATKRASNAAGGEPPAKRSRVAGAKAQPAPRKPRRQAYIPPNLSNRTFPAGIEINPGFPRFYRSFPISSAIPPESYVLQPTGNVAGSASASTSASPSVVQTQGLPLDILPTPPTPMYDQHFGFASHSPYTTSHSPPLASTSHAPSANSLPNISVDASGSFVIHDQSHAHTHPHSHYHPSYSDSPYPLPSSAEDQEMAPPALLQHPQASPALPNGPFAHLNLMQPPDCARWNKAGDPLNLYYPRFVKGSADDKCGMCPICAEPPERGGEGDHKWLKVSLLLWIPSFSRGPSSGLFSFISVLHSSRIRVMSTT